MNDRKQVLYTLAVELLFIYLVAPFIPTGFGIIGMVLVVTGFPMLNYYRDEREFREEIEKLTAGVS